MKVFFTLSACAGSSFFNCRRLIPLKLRGELKLETKPEQRTSVQ
jgi:hypothetical protein